MAETFKVQGEYEIKTNAAEVLGGVRREFVETLEIADRLRASFGDLNMNGGVGQGANPSGAAEAMRAMEGLRDDLGRLFDGLRDDLGRIGRERQDGGSDVQVHGFASLESAINRQSERLDVRLVEVVSAIRTTGNGSGVDAPGVVPPGAAPPSSPTPGGGNRAPDAVGDAWKGMQVATTSASLAGLVGLAGMYSASAKGPGEMTDATNTLGYTTAGTTIGGILGALVGSRFGAGVKGAQWGAALGAMAGTFTADYFNDTNALLKRVSEDIYGQAFAARSSGTSMPEWLAWQATAGGIGLGGLPSRLFAMSYDPMGRFNLAQSGLSQDAIMRHDGVEISTWEMRLIRDNFKRITRLHPGNAAVYWNALPGMGSLVDFNTAAGIAGMSDEEMADFMHDARQGAKNIHYDARTGRAMENLARTVRMTNQVFNANAMAVASSTDAFNKLTDRLTENAGHPLAGHEDMLKASDAAHEVAEGGAKLIHGIPKVEARIAHRVAEGGAKLAHGASSLRPDHWIDPNWRSNLDLIRGRRPATAGGSEMDAYRDAFNRGGLDPHYRPHMPYQDPRGSQPALKVDVSAPAGADVTVQAQQGAAAFASVVGGS